MPEAPKILNTFEALNQVISALRGPEGCPWDNEQTHESLAPYAIEEVFELAEAIEKKDDPHFCEELGDVLFQVILHAAMAEERKAFNIFDVIQGINSKVVRRHPHVFSNQKVKDSEEVLKNWDEIKKLEKLNSKKEKSQVLDVPAGMPALQRSHKIGEKTERYHFDWPSAKEVLQQLKAEIKELEEAMEEKTESAKHFNFENFESSEKLNHIRHEIGDVLFSAAQLARHLNIEPESALREANRRFISRFEKMLELGSLKIEDFTKLSTDEKENLWRRAKAALV